MTRRVQEIITAVLTIGIVVLVGLNSALFFFRLDLTENNAYTISEVSRNLFTEIPQQVNITYYVSDRLRNRAVETQQIIDILNEYAAYSRGRITVDVVDPQKEGIRRRVEQLGVAPQQIQVIEEDQQSLAVVYTGVVINYLDRQETLPVVFDPGTVEYRLTSSIRDLVQDENDVVGILLGNDGEDVRQDFQRLTQALSEGFDVRPIEQGQDIPPDVSVLFVIGGSGLEEFDLYPIDQFIMSGGNVMFAVDGVKVDLQRTFSAQAPENMPILDMLEGYGARVEQELVLDESNKRIPVRRPSGGIMVQTLEPYPHWVSLRGEGANRRNPITARFSGLDLYWPSPVSVTRENAEVLLETTPQAWLMQERFMINPGQAMMFGQNRDDTEGSYVVGAALRGEFESYFAGREVPTREGVERDWSNPTTSVDQGRVVVVGDSDFPSNLIQFTESGYNLDFAVNALTWLSNEEDLLQIRTRTTRDMRLTAIEDPAVKRNVARVAEIVNIYVMPLLVIGYGVVRFMRRREQSQRKSEAE